MSDIPTIQCLLEDYGNRHLDDSRELPTPQDVLGTGTAIMIDCGQWPVGCFWLHDIEPKLHAMVSCLIKPFFLRQVIQQKLFGEFIDKSFFVLKLKKLKARPLARQKSIVRLLRGYKFFGYKLWDEVRVNGKPQDVYWFELSYRHWAQKKQEILNGKHGTER